MKKDIIRTCIITRNKLSKYSMFRIVKTKSDEILNDFDYKIQGKGVYLSKDINIINKAYKNKLLNRGFKTEVKDNIYIELIQKLGETYEN